MIVIEHCFNDFDAATHYVADDYAVRIDAQLRGIHALVYVYPKVLKLRAHRRIYVAITARHFVAGGPREGGDASHEGSANAKYVYVHGFLRSRKIGGAEKAAELNLNQEYGERNQESNVPLPIDRPGDDMTLDGHRPEQQQVADDAGNSSAQHGREKGITDDEKALQQNAAAQNRRECLQ
jgi:hypothetical protein